MSGIVTYIFGAGASMGALPLVKDFNSRFFKFANDFNSKFPSINQQMGHDLSACAQAISKHSSVDTYARILYFNRDGITDLWKLKYFLSIFFYWEQRNNGVDPRYDLFLAAIMSGYQGNPKLPKNVRVLSWNYDNQFELSACKFFNRANVRDVRNNMAVYPPLKNMQMMPSFFEGFLLHKINGSADLQIDGFRGDVMLGLSPQIQSPNQQSSNDQDIIKYIDKYDKNDHQCLLHYSWEEDTIISHYRTKAMESIKATEYLVVVGYSFPTFNREMDKKIFENLKGSLKKILIQAHPDNITSIIIRVKALMPKNMNIEPAPITDLEEFYIPFEFDGEY